jgi:predicted nucleic acid-binding protein
MKYPGELYASSARPSAGIGELEYPFHDRTLTVTTCGRSQGMTVVTNNLKHFSNVPGLKVEVWS